MVTCFRYVLEVPVAQRQCSALIARLCTSLVPQIVSAPRFGTCGPKCAGIVPGMTKMSAGCERTLNLKSLLVQQHVRRNWIRYLFLGTSAIFWHGWELSFAKVAKVEGFANRTDETVLVKNV